MFMQTLLNTCTATTAAYHTIAYYTHLVPLALTVLIILIALMKGNTLRSRAFSWFGFLFSLWLLGDLLLWVLPDYTTVYVIWSALDFVNVLFCIAAIYFFHTLTDERMPRLLIATLSLIALIPFAVTVMGMSVGDLSYAYCEVANSTFLTYYKLAVEILAVMWLVAGAARLYIKHHVDRAQIAIVATSLVMFIAVFSFTDLISSLTGVYEIGLYGLFVLPLSLVLILFVIVRGSLFKMREYGIQVGVFSFIILVASQFLFIEDTTGHILNAITLILSLLIAYTLAKQVSQEHAHQKDVEELNVRLADLNQQKNEFLSLATHQLRSPLTSIKWGIEAVEDAGTQNLSELQTKTLYHIATTVNDLIRVVGDLLDTSKIDQGKLTLNKTAVDIEKMVRKVVDEFAIVAGHKGLSLIPDIAVLARPLMYTGDESKLQQAITNLIDNAIKYTPNGSVKVSLRDDPSTITIAISDTGAGIPESELPKLFAKFVRGEAGKKASGGSGLGLYLVKQVIEMHGGSVSAASAGEGQGATFTITLRKN